MLPVALMLVLLSVFNVAFGYRIGTMKELDTFDFLGGAVDEGKTTGMRIF